MSAQLRLMVQSASLCKLHHNMYCTLTYKQFLEGHNHIQFSSGATQATQRNISETLYAQNILIEAVLHCVVLDTDAILLCPSLMYKII